MSPAPAVDRVLVVSDVFAQALNGLAYGVLLFLLSVGLTLIFGMLDIVNLAHGSYYMLGAYAGVTVLMMTGQLLARPRGRPRGGGPRGRWSSSGSVSGRSTGAGRWTRCSSPSASSISSRTSSSGSGAGASARSPLPRCSPRR